MRQHSSITTNDERRTTNAFARALAALSLTATLILAQPPTPGDNKSIPVSKVERKRKAPVSSEVLRVKLPKPTEIKLDNGITLLILEDHKLPTVSVQLSINGAGGLFEPAETPGVASLTAQMLKEGTSTRTSKQIAEQLDQLGATMNAGTSFGATSTSISVSGLKDNMPQWLGLAADVLLNPTFPQEELDKLKQRQKAQLTMIRSNPGFLVQERFFKAVYGDHRAATISPTPESFDKITREMLVKWHHEHYVPQNVRIGVAGDITAAEWAAMLEGMPTWDATGTGVPPVPPTTPATAKKVYLVDRPGSVQTDLWVGNITLSRTDPDYMAMELMNRIVGGGPAGRLFVNLREAKGFTYGAYSGLIAGHFAGPWFAQVSNRTNVTGDATTELMKEIARIRDEKVPESELEECKRSMVAAFALSLEQPARLLNYAMMIKEYNLPADYWDTYPAKMMQITAEQVQRVARKYINMDTLQMVAVGDASKIKSDLEKFGPLVVYDTQGKIVP
jgi:predicted Zn-dependent peptidase